MAFRISKILILILSVSIFVGKLPAQPAEGEAIDKIVAVVGSDIIMESEIRAQVLMFAQQDPSLDPNNPEVRKRVLDMMINEKLVTMKAIEDSVEVTDDEIKAQWDMKLREWINYYGSVKRIEDLYGMSIDRIQFEFKDEIRNSFLAEKIKRMKFSDIKVTQRETEEFYDLYKDSLPAIPAQVELYHIVRNVQPTRTTKEQFYKLAMSVRDSLIKGGNFADFAARYSGDPGTATSGGDLGWSQKGKLFTEFEQMAISLQKGEISLPTETPFGFHLIELLGKNRDSIHARHILFKYGQSTEDKEEVINFLNKLRETAMKKDTSFEELARKYSDENETRGFGGLVGKFPLNNIPGAMQELINKMDIGGISEPLPYSSEPKVSYHILYKKSIIPEHKASLQTDYKELEQMTKSYKQSKMYQDWVENLRKTIYWEIK